MNPYSIPIQTLQMMMGFMKMLEEQKLIEEQQQRMKPGTTQEMWKRSYQAQAQNPWHDPLSPYPSFQRGMGDLVSKIPPIIALMGML